MKHLLSLFILLLFTSSIFSQIVLTPRYLLSKPFSPEKISQIMSKHGEWHPYPQFHEREDWEDLPESQRQIHITKADRWLDYQWPALTASLALEFVRTGNRSNYQSISSERRQAMSDMILAELIEGKGRYIDQIVNGVWMICEESYWGAPAHLYFQSAGYGLVDVEEHTVDLYVAETSSLLSWTDYLLGEKLDEVSPLLRKRIRLEIKERILDVNLTRDDFWWLGFERNEKGINNWTPWINSNWLTAVLLIEEDSTRRVEAFHRIFRSLDEFINQYPDDGGCDEGPTYWTRAAASLFDCLDLLYSTSNGEIDLFSHDLIKQMGSFIYRTHIDGEYYLNFADAGAKIKPNGTLIYRFGKMIKDDQMQAFGAYIAHGQKQLYEPTVGRSLGRRLPGLFFRDEISRAKPSQPLIGEVWLPDSEIMVARSQAGKSDGFCLATSGGNNGHSHNHNDVGSFMLYLDGKPALIDVGVETYTKKTFSDDRYSIWTMQSGYHNLPMIGDFMQNDGWEFKAKEMSYEKTDLGISFSVDIADAYPDAARVKTWQRNFFLDRKKGEVALEENFILEGKAQEISLSLMTPDSVKVLSDGRILVHIPKEGTQETSQLEIHYDEGLFYPKAEIIPIKDVKLKGIWGERIGRIRLISHKPMKKGNTKIYFRKAE